MDSSSDTEPTMENDLASLLATAVSGMGKRIVTMDAILQSQARLNDSLTCIEQRLGISSDDEFMTSHGFPAEEAATTLLQRMEVLERDVDGSRKNVGEVRSEGQQFLDELCRAPGADSALLKKTLGTRIAKVNAYAPGAQDQSTETIHRSNSNTHQTSIKRKRDPLDFSSTRSPTATPSPLPSVPSDSPECSSTPQSIQDDDSTIEAVNRSSPDDRSKGSVSKRHRVSKLLNMPGSVPNMSSEAVAASPSSVIIQRNTTIFRKLWPPSSSDEPYTMDQFLDCIEAPVFAPASNITVPVAFLPEEVLSVLRAQLNHWLQPTMWSRFLPKPRSHGLQCLWYRIDRHQSAEFTDGLSACDECYRRNRICVNHQRRGTKLLLLPLAEKHRQGSTFCDVGYWLPNGELCPVSQASIP